MTSIADFTSTTDRNTILERRARVDLPRLRAATAETADKIRGLKTILRAPWPDHGWSQLQVDLVILKRRATHLCILRAWTHGKVHSPRYSTDDVARIMHGSGKGRWRTVGLFEEFAPPPPAPADLTSPPDVHAAVPLV